MTAARAAAAELKAVERRIAVGRDRAASASAALRGALLSARSGAHQVLSYQEELSGLKNRFRGLEADLAQALFIKLAKESKCELTRESISSSSAMNEHLKKLVTDGRNKRDQHATVISDELKAVETLEAKSSKDEALRKDIEKAVTWCYMFLGLQVVVGGEGVKFVFDKIDLQSPEKEYSFSLKFDKDIYTLLRCDPPMKDSEELVKDLNLTKDLFKFVRIIRQRFQAASLNGILPVSPVVRPDASSIPVSSPVVMSIHSRSGNAVDQSHSRSKTKKQALPTKRRAAALSAASSSAVRRSPRFSAASPCVVCRSPCLSAASPGDVRSLPIYFGNRFIFSRYISI